MELNSGKILAAFSPKRIALPILLGLGVVSFFLFQSFSMEAFSRINWTLSSTFWILMAFVMVAVRDLAYMYRIRVLTHSALSWKASFNVIFLWEFASAIAPPILGGGFAFAIFILNGEKVKMGKSIAVVMFTSFLDGLFFALMAPLVFFLIGKEILFSGVDLDPDQLVSFVKGQELYFVFWIIYFIVIAYKILVGYALFVNAEAVKWLILRIFSLPFLEKWKKNAEETGNEMVLASAELKKASLGYWLKSTFATFVSWGARFLIINFIILAFNTNAGQHFLLYARQVVMGILNIGSPTPGGSGLAEAAFVKFLGEFIPQGLSPTLALLWRLISYYPYLFIGVVLLPRWIKKVFLEK